MRKYEFTSLENTIKKLEHNRMFDFRQKILNPSIKRTRYAAIQCKSEDNSLNPSGILFIFQEARTIRRPKAELFSDKLKQIVRALSLVIIMEDTAANAAYSQELKKIITKDQSAAPETAYCPIIDTSGYIYGPVNHLTFYTIPDQNTVSDRGCVDRFFAELKEKGLLPASDFENINDFFEQAKAAEQCSTSNLTL